MCSSYILLFVCSCNAVGWIPEHLVVIIWFSHIDLRNSSQQNKERVQTSRPPLLVVGETQILEEQRRVSLQALDICAKI